MGKRVAPAGLPEVFWTGIGILTLHFYQISVSFTIGYVVEKIDCWAYS